MERTIQLERMLSEWGQWQLIDVRSPGEYAAGHIQGAVNIPLFSDEERSRVGTLYKQVSPEVAFREGLQLAGANLTRLLDEVSALRKETGKMLLVHCWRGGKRSQAVQWLFSFAGIEADRLEGGYKSFRQYLHSYFSYLPFTLKIIGGCTGAGKTEILQIMESKGAQVIDLERLVCHKGSAFGAIGEAPQPTTEQFENDLFFHFHSFNPTLPVWLENESRSIGKVHLPEGIWQHMRKSKLYTIEVDEAIRLERVLRYYATDTDIQHLKSSFERIRKRIGGADLRQAIEALDQQDLRKAASIALHYYDKTYMYQIGQWTGEAVVTVPQCHDPEEAANRLLRMS